MHAIRILANCLASGIHMEEGAVLAVPDQIGAADAGALVRMGRAVKADKPVRKKRNEKSD